MEMRQTNVRDTEKISTLDYIEKTIAILQQQDIVGGTKGET